MQDLKKIKKIIIIILILIIIFSIILCITLFNQKKQEEQAIAEEIEQFSDESIDYNNVKVEEVTGNIEFYTIRNCVQSYFDVLNTDSSMYYGKDANNNYVKVIDDNTIKQSIYNLLSEKYIKENNITIDNLFNYVEEMNESVLFVPIKMNILKGENVDKYAVYGFIEDKNFYKKKDIYIFVNKDKVNGTFSIELINENYNNIDEITIENEKQEIPANGNNKYQNPQITEEYIAQSYFDTYKQIVLGEPKLAYEYMNEEYRTKRFENYENFEKYVEENRQKIMNWGITKYLVNQDGQYSEYICLDAEENYYIFKEKGSLEYEVFLDNYTIESEEFLTKYNSGDEKTKAGMNVEKFFEALNRKDYTYIYEHLADSFKNNYYQSQEDFEKNIKEQLFEYNDKEYIKYEQQGNVHVFEISVSDKEDEEQKKAMTVIVQLKEGTDFVMSYSIQ